MASKNSVTITLSPSELEHVEHAIAASQVAGKQQIGRENASLTRVEKKIAAAKEAREVEAEASPGGTEEGSGDGPDQS